MTLSIGWVFPAFWMTGVILRDKCPRELSFPESKNMQTLAALKSNSHFFDGPLYRDLFSFKACQKTYPLDIYEGARILLYCFRVKPHILRCLTAISLQYFSFPLGVGHLSRIENKTIFSLL